MKILITGASSGIGKALAVYCAKAGHHLLLVARRDAELSELCQQLSQQYQIQCDYISADLAVRGQCLSLFHQIEERGFDVDCLINNAGIGYLGDFTDMNIDKMHTMIDLNVVALSELTMLYAQAFKKKGGGKILQVASIAGLSPGPYMAAYYASKAYVVRFSQALAYELKGTGVDVSILCPGPTNTGFLKQSTHGDKGDYKIPTGMMSADAVARIGFEGMLRGKLFIYPGFINKIMAALTNVTPAWLKMYLVTFVHRRL